MNSIVFKHSKYDTCVYFKFIIDGFFIILLLYIKDIHIAGNIKSEVQKVKIEMDNVFEMKDLGTARKILRIEILVQ